MKITALPREGCDRCWCGAKYWDGNICHSCGEQYDPDVDALGYVVDDEGRSRCADCGVEFEPRSGARVVEGSVRRSHRRNCTVRPEYVRTPGVCDA